MASQNAGSCCSDPAPQPSPVFFSGGSEFVRLSGLRNCCAQPFDSDRPNYTLNLSEIYSGDHIAIGETKESPGR